MAVAGERAREQTRLAQHLEAVADAEDGPASLRSTTSCIGGAGGDRAGAEVVAVGEATGEDDGVDVLEVVVGVPQRDQFTPASRTAQAASTSSREPGKVRTPMRKRMRPFSRS